MREVCEILFLAFSIAMIPQAQTRPCHWPLSRKSVRSSCKSRGACDAPLRWFITAGWIITAFRRHGDMSWSLLTGHKMMSRQQKRTCSTCWVGKQLECDLPGSASMCQRCVIQKTLYLGCHENSVISLWEIIKLYKTLGRCQSSWASRNTLV